ncbi:MAG: hypothetical protein PHQ75_01455 [Thermoguttaceae bacterium]|nr:hypothetical protein [Thermoguttaceae bacterium]
MSLVTELADAVVAELNRKDDWSIPFEAKRVAVPRKDIKDLENVIVSVVPSSLRMTNATRGATKVEIEIDIGIQKHLTDELTEVAALGTLVDEIVLYIKERTLTAKPYAQWTETVNNPIYVPEHIAQKRVFTSVITIKYQQLK